MRDFLEGRFEVGDRDTRATVRHAAELGLQDLLQDETVCRLHPGVQVQRRQYGLQRIHQQCWLFAPSALVDRKSTRLNCSHGYISYAVFCLKKKNKENQCYNPDYSVTPHADTLSRYDRT